MYQNKSLKYYFDSRIYSSEQVQESIEETKKEFPNKKIKVTIGLNEFGAYIVTFKFENKDNYLDKIRINLSKRFKRTIVTGDTIQGKVYGQYKSTNAYKPY